MAPQLFDKPHSILDAGTLCAAIANRRGLDLIGFPYVIRISKAKSIAGEFDNAISFVTKGQTSVS